MKKKNSPLKMFMKGFFKSFFIIALLFLVGYGSYKLTMFYYKLEGPPQNSKTNKLIRDIVSDATVDEISKNLIFSSDKVSGEVKGLVLEIVNTNTNNVDYITIPENTQITLNNDMYQRLCVINPEIPQIIKFSDLYKYFEEDYVYEYGVLILEDYLDIDISYYTGMEESYFNTIFENNEDRLVLTQEWKNTFFSAKSEDDMKDIIKGMYDKISSNLSMKKKEEYIPTYINVEPEFIYFYHINGEQKIEGYMIDAESSNAMINEIINNDAAYTVKQEESSDQPGQIISSKDYNIKISNGSKITGLAAHYKEKLTLEGYQITGIYNYSGETVNTTKIIVNSDGLGQDLAAYFDDPMITVEELDEGIDIHIILGTKDDAK
ncbi:LytR cell envelope-related transcriptional attenuator [Mobilisporobacter senegalensis]|uniref:LytR cell envelope-related transcriptional attenuator n=2 Tax=Mobilisporobacter senegalensis TaxID=1329262 RepID=A0A3N1XYK0_9FIRM|nr:LytR cell envelope-related transcriptional attenuator [Mobilisporobacter senegalensis]